MVCLLLLGLGIGIDRLTMMLTNQHSIQEVLFFPQMKPEKVESKAVLSLNDNEKAIYDVISDRQSMDLSELRSMVELSNKQWDKGMKALNKLGLTKVTKTDDALIVELVEGK